MQASKGDRPAEDNTSESESESSYTTDVEELPSQDQVFQPFTIPPPSEKVFTEQVVVNMPPPPSPPPIVLSEDEVEILRGIHKLAENKAKKFHEKLNAVKIGFTQEGQKLVSLVRGIMSGLDSRLDQFDVEVNQNSIEHKLFAEYRIDIGRLQTVQKWQYLYTMTNEFIRIVPTGNFKTLKELFDKIRNYIQTLDSDLDKEFTNLYKDGQTYTRIIEFVREYTLPKLNPV